MSRLYLMSDQVIQAIQTLEGERLPLRTLSAWASRGVAPASIRHDRTRGRYHPRLYSMFDLACVRLTFRLRLAGLVMARVQEITQHPAVVDALKLSTQADLLVSRQRVAVRYPGEPAQEIPSGQFHLSLSEVTAGNEEIAKQILAAA